MPTQSANLHTATALASWLRALHAALRERGIDPEPLFLRAGLDSALLGDPNARYPLAGTTALWGLALEASGDEAIGLEVGRHITQTSFHALGYALLASPTLIEAFERLLRYFRIVTDAGDLEFSVEAAVCRFELLPTAGPAQPAAAAIDALMGVIIRLCRALYGRAFRAAEVSLRRPRPADPTPFERVFKCPVRFAAASNSLVFDRAAGEQPLPGGNAELARHNDRIIDRYLRQLGAGSVSQRVQARLIEDLPHGEPSQEAIARRLNLSLRSLQRHLAAEDSSYKHILNATREALAREYLAEPGYSISEIAFMLGFADSSSFTRAFRRWTGVTPQALRNDG